MPDLGEYAAAVLASYAAGLGLLVVLVAHSLWRGARVRAALAEIEARQAKGEAE